MGYNMDSIMVGLGKVEDGQGSQMQGVTTLIQRRKAADVKGIDVWAHILQHFSLYLCTSQIRGIMGNNSCHAYRSFLHQS